MESSAEGMVDMMMLSGAAGIDLAMAEGPSVAGRPRPVAGVPPPELADGTAAARAWLLALVAATPLEAMGSLPTGRVASEGPGLCAAALEALGSDAALTRLEPGGDRAATAAGAGRLAGAPSPTATAAAIAALRGALWSVLEPGLPAADGRHVAALAGRLAHVCDAVMVASLAAAPPPSAAAPAGAPAAIAPSAPPASPAAGPPPDAPAPAGPRAPSAPSAAPPFTPPSEVSWPAGAPDLTVSRGGSGAGEIAAVVRRVERRAAEGQGFAVLAVEVDEAGRLLAADRGGAVARALSAAERAVREAAERAGAGVTADGERQWIVAPHDGAAGARALGERLAAAVATAVTLDGTPLEVSIGVAVWPHDGRDAEALLAHADEGVFAARAAGVRVA
jgi:GGDEF domain-containing protein